MTSIGGLPAHILLVHAVVVLLPLASGLAILGSIWPRAQRKFTFLTPGAALVGLIAVPFAVAAGNALLPHIPTVNDSLVRHMTLGARVLPFALALFVFTAAQWAYFQFRQPTRWLTIVLAVLVIAAAIATTAQVGLTGDAGSRAVWGSLLK